jgi:hypothetical protein
MTMASSSRTRREPRLAVDTLYTVGIVTEKLPLSVVTIIISRKGQECGQHEERERLTVERRHQYH